MAINEEI